MNSLHSVLCQELYPPDREWHRGPHLQKSEHILIRTGAAPPILARVDASRQHSRSQSSGMALVTSRRLLSCRHSRTPTTQSSRRWSHRMHPLRNLLKPASYLHTTIGFSAVFFLDPDFLPTFCSHQVKPRLASLFVCSII
jgi:hypothetical protein